MNIGNVAGLHNKVWFRAGKARCAVVKIAAAGLPKKSSFPVSFADKGSIDSTGTRKTSIVSAAVAETINPRADVVCVSAAVTVKPVVAVDSVAAGKVSGLQGTESSCSVAVSSEIGMWGWSCRRSDPIWVMVRWVVGADDGNVATKSLNLLAYSKAPGPDGFSSG